MMAVPATAGFVCRLGRLRQAPPIPAEEREATILCSSR